MSEAVGFEIDALVISCRLRYTGSAFVATASCLAAKREYTAMFAEEAVSGAIGLMAANEALRHYLRETARTCFPRPEAAP